MPNLLVSAATGALGPVLHKLAALLGEKYKRFKGVRREIEFLIRELEAMHAFLLKKSEEENPDVQDKAWMKEVRELSYDIEDSLDDFTVHVGDDSAKPDGFINKCKNLLDKTKARHRIAKAIQDLKLQVEEVSARNKRYESKVTVMNTSKVTVDSRALAIFKDASSLVGIDKAKQDLTSFLTKEDGGISSQQPKMVSIVGIGGIGKTTLAKEVYEELTDKHPFECHAFLSVSRDPDMFKIFRNIHNKVTGQRSYETDAMDIPQFIQEIKGFLRTKRYFIVIDDIWKIETWEMIKLALPDNSCSSVIVTTTRIHNVAKACCSFYSDGWVYQPNPLDDQDSKRLFQNRIFGPGNEGPEYLKEVSDKILNKCGGLPLAIITISGLLANKARNGAHSVTEWDQVQTSIGHGLGRDSTVEGMMRILSLSYFDLPPHLKACLLYLSIFPEDYKIEKKRLVLLWIAEGFISAEFTCTLYESGEKAFNDLINRSLIIPGRINKERTGEVLSCIVHDTILDFIVCKSTEDNFVTVHGIPGTTPSSGIKVRRWSLQGKTKGDVTLDSNQNYANVRSIVSSGFRCSLLGFRFLRVLDFTGCHWLRNHDLAYIGELLQMRYLSLRDTSIYELPEQIGELKHLETLDVEGNEIILLPAAIVRLKRLVNLLMSPSPLGYFPSGIKNMQALERLEFVGISIYKAATFVEEIGDVSNMRHLRIRLLCSSYVIIDVESYVDLLKKMISSFQRLNKLQSLDIQLCNEEGRDSITFDGDDVILEVPWYSTSLRNLVFLMNPMSRVPSWIKSLVNIEELELRIKKLDQESLCILSELAVLVYLKLEMVNYVEGILSTDKQRLVVNNRYGYRSLRYFLVECYSFSPSSIPMLAFEAGSMPKLEKFHIYFDADITISVSNGRLDFGLKHLSQLTTVVCIMLGTELSVLLVEAAIQKELDNHPNLPYFEKQSILSTEAVPTPTDISFSIHHHGASPDLGRQHGQRQRRSKACRDATIRGPELVQGALHSPCRAQGTSGAFLSVTDVLGPRLIAAPQEERAYVPPCSTVSSVVCTSGDNDRVSASFASKKMWSSTGAGQSLTAALPLPTDLSFTIHHDGTSPGLDPRHRQPRRRSKARQGATIPGRELVHGVPLIHDHVNRTSGAAPAPSDVLGPGHIAAPRQQEAFVKPCFTFSSGSPPNAEAEQQAMDCSEPSQHDDLANAFSSAFDELSLGNEYPGSSATAVEAASSKTGAAPATSDVLRPRLIAAPQQQETLVTPCFTFSAGSPPNSEAEQQAKDCHQPSQHESPANAFSTAFNSLSLRNDHPGLSDTAVEAASSETGTQTNRPVLRIVVPRRRSSGRAAK